jgi:hypothetical protein
MPCLAGNRDARCATTLLPNRHRLHILRTAGIVHLLLPTLAQHREIHCAHFTLAKQRRPNVKIYQKF